MPVTAKSEAVKFEPNVPQEITLAYDSGKEISKPNMPPAVMYKLTDGRVMFVPAEVRDKISEAKVRKGEPFTIVRRESVNGSVKVEWKIGRTAAQMAAVAKPEGVTPGRLARALCAVVDAVAQAQKHAKEIGFEAMPQFTSEDLRTMTNTILIEARR